MGEITKKGVMKKTCISPMAVALPVCWYIQMVRPNWLIAEAMTETICPIQTMVKPNMPEGRCSERWAGVIGGVLRNRKIALIITHNHEEIDWMVPYHIITRPAFTVLGWKTWIAGQDNSLFGAFWERCRAEGLFGHFAQIGAGQPGAQTGGVTLGISRVERDPARREFDYMIAVERPQGAPVDGFEEYLVPACTWAAFECRGRVPESIVRAEMFAFMEWLPQSGYVHALAPEMEVYLPGGSSDEVVSEFWLPLSHA
jgi:AraC family transcriptional regulator